MLWLISFPIEDTRRRLDHWVPIRTQKETKQKEINIKPRKSMRCESEKYRLKEKNEYDSRYNRVLCVSAIEAKKGRRELRVNSSAKVLITIRTNRANK